MCRIPLTNVSNPPTAEAFGALPGGRGPGPLGLRPLPPAPKTQGSVFGSRLSNVHTYICMHMYTCEYTYICIHEHVYVYVYIHTHVHVCMHGRLYVKIYIYIYLHMCKARVCMCVYVCVH